MYRCHYIVLRVEKSPGATSYVLSEVAFSSYMGISIDAVCMYLQVASIRTMQNLHIFINIYFFKVWL